MRSETNKQAGRRRALPPATRNQIVFNEILAWLEAPIDLREPGAACEFAVKTPARHGEAMRLPLFLIFKAERLN